MNKTALQILQNSTFGAFAEQHQLTDENLKFTLQHSINQWNLEYQQGNPSVSDEFYDFIREFYQEYFGEIESHAEIEDSDERKVELPIIAGSMNKCKTLDELKKWAKSKGFDFDTTEFVISPKYDGITLINDEKPFAPNNNLVLNSNLRSWTKGKDGFGLFVPDHFKYINDGGKNKTIVDNVEIMMTEGNVFSRGEAIMKRSVFEQKYSKEVLGEKDGFENARNLVASRFVEKEPNSEMLKDIDFIRFHLDSENFNNSDKDNMLNFCNKLNNVQIPYIIAQGSELTEAYLKEFFIAWSNEYELDGLIIDINKFELRNRLGLETSTNNPCYARAYKAAEFDPEADTKVLEVINQIDKNGILNPVLIIEPIRLGGVTINRVHGKNHRFMNIYGIGIGSNLKIRRSGNVIAEVVEVEGFPTMEVSDLKKLADKHFNPNQSTVHIRKMINESVGIDIETYNYEYDEMFYKDISKWDDSFTNLILNNPNENNDVQIQKIVSFFETIGAEGISDGLIADLYYKGFRDVKEILSLTDTEILTKFNGWGEKKAINFIDSIKKAIEKVDLPTLAHATGFFGFLGSKKLALVEKLSDMDWMPTLEELNKIEGYSDISSAAFIDGFDRFWHFVLDNNIKVNIKKPKEILGNKMVGKNVVFTGIRDKELENWIEQNGGKIGSGVSKSTSILIMKEIGSGSSKESKAIELGIEIETLESFKGKYVTT